VRRHSRLHSYPLKQRIKPISLHPSSNSKTQNTFQISKKKWRARWDLNPGPPAPQASVIIRTRLRAHRDRLRYYCVPKYEVFSLRNSFVSEMSVKCWNLASMSCVASSTVFVTLQIYSSFCRITSSCV
jgi:hypothetical protein